MRKGKLCWRLVGEVDYVLDPGGMDGCVCKEGKGRREG